MSKFRLIANFQQESYQLFQKLVGNSSVGYKVIRATSGSSSSSYRQRLWLTPSNKLVRFSQCVEVPGDSSAGLLARQWTRATILAIDASAMQRDEITAGSPNMVEALAFKIGKATHAGLSQDGNPMFYKLDNATLIAAVRQRKQPITYSLGYYDKAANRFHGVQNGHMRALEVNVPVNELAERYSGLELS